MTGPEQNARNARNRENDENEDDAERSEPILAPPTANPSRVKVPPEGLRHQDDDGEPAPPGPPEEEA
ncbi:hypothetical protein ACFY3U_12800 [Micromonospora sp. NPDC000089]|uniref:hypothetical protein n=1 Tax=unclassified Micromonospora TaxID=2617518 RepID=UPI0036D00C00